MNNSNAYIKRRAKKLGTAYNVNYDLGFFFHILLVIVNTTQNFQEFIIIIQSCNKGRSFVFAISFSKFHTGFLLRSLKFSPNNQFLDFMFCYCVIFGKNFKMIISFGIIFFIFYNLFKLFKIVQLKYYR